MSDDLNVIRLKWHKVELERYTRTVDLILLIHRMLTPYDMAAQRELERPRDVSGRQFEEMCLIIYSHQYTDAMFYGRGHLQHGIDLKMRELRADGAVRDVLVQCKDTKTLSPSDLEKDMAAALRRWAPTASTQPDLLYVVATTVEHPDTDGFDATFTKIRDQMMAAPLRDKVKLLVHGRADLTRFVRATPALTEYFLEPLADHGVPESVDLERIGKCLGECLDAGRLKEALQYWGQAERAHPGARLPAGFSDNLVDLFLRAGDFAALDRHLDRLLATRRYRAGYWVAYLRAKRFTTKVTRPLTFNELMATRPTPPFDLGATIRQQMASLLVAQGTLDETLTLATWIVTYGEHAVARAGLLRALSLIRQHWTRVTELELPGSEDHLTVRDGRLVPIGQAPRPDYILPMPTTVGERAAVVLVQAYEYLRMLFATRFDRPSLLAAESAAQGWTDFFDEDRNALSVEDYFARLGARGFEEEVEARFGEAELTGFYAEAMRMQFGWSETDMVYVDERPANIPYSVVCTSRVLLADCEYDYFEQRRSEALLIAPTLAIERVLATLSLLDILDDDVRRSSGGSEGNGYSKRADKVRALVRACSLDQRREGRREVLVRPVYEDAQAIDPGSASHIGFLQAPASGHSGGHGQSNTDRATAELDAAIAMSNSGTVPMIGSFCECQRAEASGALRVRRPWCLALNGQSMAGMRRP